MHADNDVCSRRPDTVAVHSVDRFVFTVPVLAKAKEFYKAFGLDVQENGRQLDLYTHGYPHCWASIFEAGDRKRLQYVRLGIFADDVPVFRKRIEHLGIGIPPSQFGSDEGIWFCNPDGIAMQFVVAPKVSPSTKSAQTPAGVVKPGEGAAPSRSAVTAVQPRRLSHLLLFSPEVMPMVEFCQNVLGLRLSDHSGDLIAFVHSPHGSDHHLLAFAKSHAAGLHHSSWDVGSIDDVGLGAEQMRLAGWENGWGIGRHVLGSNYFYYARDPWGSYSEYSFGIDFIPADLDWPAKDHDAADSFYVWGPSVPADFVVNHEEDEPAQLS